jgi:hypothetical protein
MLYSRCVAFGRTLCEPQTLQEDLVVAFFEADIVSLEEPPDCTTAAGGGVAAGAGPLERASDVLKDLKREIERR